LDISFQDDKTIILLLGVSFTLLYFKTKNSPSLSHWSKKKQFQHPPPPFRIPIPQPFTIINFFIYLCKNVLFTLKTHKYLLHSNYLQKNSLQKDMFMPMPPAINSAVSVCKFLAANFSLYMVIGIYVHIVDDVTAMICLLVLECAEFSAKKWRWAAIQQTQGSGFLWLLSKPSPCMG
jgi:hypothetical protein